MFNKVVFAFFFCVFQTSIALVTEGYYWKDFKGEVPDDAIKGGKSANGEPIYIGQVLHYDKLLPAKILTNDNKAYFAWNAEQSTTENIKILCSPYPERFQWIPTHKNEIHLLTNEHVINGGAEPNQYLYIGRALYKSETLVGKVRTADKASQNLGLYITSQKKEAVLDTFEILVYSPEANSTEIRHCNKKVVVVRN
ncbi:hypothetical protein FQA39_LY11580 [Lamprigera yunnana]|nr:hypothetical protein FQA39_LY11580 [Lamprigera yunnana]